LRTIYAATHLLAQSTMRSASPAVG